MPSTGYPVIMRQPLVQDGLAKDALFTSDKDGVFINVQPGSGPHLSGPNEFAGRTNNLPSGAVPLGGPMLVRLNNYRSHTVAEVRYWWRNSGKMPNNIRPYVEFYGQGNVLLATLKFGTLPPQRDKGWYYQFASHNLDTFAFPAYAPGEWTLNTAEPLAFTDATEAVLSIPGGEWD